MKTIETIIQEAAVNQWPYPKTFEALKAAGVQMYEVFFTDQFRTVYHGTFGTWEKNSLEGYRPSKIGEQFSSEGIKSSIVKHGQEKTPYTQFLIDITACGVSHYRVYMDTREVIYFNPDETHSHTEPVPHWKDL